VTDIGVKKIGDCCMIADDQIQEFLLLLTNYIIRGRYRKILFLICFTQTKIDVKEMADITEFMDVIHIISQIV
jgi:hypothetical protein